MRRRLDRDCMLDPVKLFLSCSAINKCFRFSRGRGRYRNVPGSMNASGTANASLHPTPPGASDRDP
jgi:hypothetical protein